jgi:hypothetical protein
MCELARNSVIQSGWEMKIKQHWIGKKWYQPGPSGNDMQKTNVSNIRLAFRYETLKEELSMLDRYAGIAEDISDTADSSNGFVLQSSAEPMGFTDPAMIGVSSLVDPTKLQQDMIHNNEIEPRENAGTATASEETQQSSRESRRGSFEDTINSEIWHGLSGSEVPPDYTFPGASVLAQRARQRRISLDTSNTHHNEST